MKRIIKESIQHQIAETLEQDELDFDLDTSGEIDTDMGAVDADMVDDVDMDMGAEGIDTVEDSVNISCDAFGQFCTMLVDYINNNDLDCESISTAICDYVRDNDKVLTSEDIIEIFDQFEIEDVDMDAGMDMDADMDMVDTDMDDDFIDGDIDADIDAL